MIAALRNDIIMLILPVLPGETEEIQEEEEARPWQHDLHQRGEGAVQHARQTGERDTYSAHTSKKTFKSKCKHK